MGVTMKTIDVKSMLIGFLLCACGFLFMGFVEEHTHQAYDIEGKILAYNVYITRFNRAIQKNEDVHLNHYLGETFMKVYEYEDELNEKIRDLNMRVKLLEISDEYRNK